MLFLLCNFLIIIILVRCRFLALLLYRLIVSNCTFVRCVPSTAHCRDRLLAGAAYPLDIQDRRYFHPSSRAQWERVPGRPTAWRLHPYSYMWVPSSQLFPAVGHSHTGSFPREFTLLVTLRLHPQVRSEIKLLSTLMSSDVEFCPHTLVCFACCCVPKRHQLTEPCSGVTLCFLWSRNHISINMTFVFQEKLNFINALKRPWAQHGHCTKIE
jgi:hypothetical protein